MMHNCEDDVTVLTCIPVLLHSCEDDVTVLTRKPVLMHRCQSHVTDYCTVAKATTRLCCTTVRTTSRRAMQGGMGMLGDAPFCCAAAKRTSRSCGGVGIGKNH